MISKAKYLLYFPKYINSTLIQPMLRQKLSFLVVSITSLITYALIKKEISKDFRRIERLVKDSTLHDKHWSQRLRSGIVKASSGTSLQKTPTTEWSFSPTTSSHSPHSHHFSGTFTTS